MCGPYLALWYHGQLGIVCTMKDVRGYRQKRNSDQPWKEFNDVGDTGFEPATSPMSTGRSEPTELITPIMHH